MSVVLRPSLLAAALILTGIFPAPAQSARNGIAAVVNGNVITESEVRDAVTYQSQMLRMQLQSDPVALQRELAKLHESALESLIDRELVLAEFKRMGASIKPQWVDDDINAIIRENFKGDRDAFIRELAKTGLTMKKFREMREKMMIVQAMRGQHGGVDAPATPKEVEDFYRKNAAKWRKGDMIKISTITIPKYSGEASATPESQKKLANEIRSKLLNGADFATVAKAYSQDSHAEDGGAWDWMERTQMKPSIARVAFELKTGGLSEVIDEEGSYIIIACDAVKLGDSPPLSKVREEIERAVTDEKSRAAVDKWMERLRKRATIKIMSR